MKDEGGEARARGRRVEGDVGAAGGGWWATRGRRVVVGGGPKHSQWKNVEQHNTILRMLRPYDMIAPPPTI